MTNPEQPEPTLHPSLNSSVDKLDGKPVAGHGASQLGAVSFLKFFLSTATTIFTFALALSVILTVGLFGLKIISHGVPMCLVLAQNNLLSQILYTSCGCALVEIVLSAISILVLWKTTPRLIRLTRQIHEIQRERFKKFR